MKGHRGPLHRAQRVGQPPAWRCRCCRRSGGLAANRISGFLQDTTQAMAHPSSGDRREPCSGRWTRGGCARRPAHPAGRRRRGGGDRRRPGRTPLHAQGPAVQFSRISPKAGLSGMFSAQGSWTLGKTLLKMAVLAMVGLLILSRAVARPCSAAPPSPCRVDPGRSHVDRRSTLRYIGVLALVIAGGDYFFQRRTYQQNLRMTKQEIRTSGARATDPPRCAGARRSKARRFSQHAHDGRRGQCGRRGTNPPTTRWRSPTTGPERPRAPGRRQRGGVHDGRGHPASTPQLRRA